MQTEDLEKIRMQYIIIGGFNSSGSSAVIDLLKEFETVHEYNCEMRFICDPYGVKELDSSLTERWDLINSAAAMQDFLDMCKKGCRKKSYFPLAGYGMGYCEKINPRFMQITEQYLDRLTEFKFLETYFHFKSKTPYFRYVLDRCLYGLEYYTHGKLHAANRNIQPLRFAHPSREKFYLETKRYFDELFNVELLYKQHKNYIVLDQALAPNDADLVEKYFNNGKMIIVDRDPRDMFADLIFNGVLMEDKTNTEECGRHFVKRQIALREHILLNENIMRIYFEDLIYHYEKTRERIMDFLEMASMSPCAQKKFFNPEISKKNVGLWKRIYKDYNHVMDAIAIELKDYLYKKERI